MTFGSVAAPSPATSRSSEAFGALANARPRTAGLGVYVHVPFCAGRCHYCSFNTAPLEEPAMARYLAALAREIDLLGALPWAGEIAVTSVFFGGGTPSLLDGDALGAILERLRRRFRMAADAEITAECNPESVSRPKLEAYRRAAVNRLSLGVQSLDDGILRHLGRLHTAATARAAFDAARDAGFANVSVDLMYGLPGLDADAWAGVVAALLAWAPEHVSAYGLTLDAGSLWGAAGVDGLPDEEAVIAQYWALAREAAARGYEHYEISNYARSGFRSRHNQVYWRRGEYLACGPGACGFAGDLRWANVKAVGRYCAALEEGRLPLDSSERLTARQALAERLILGLRTADGVPTAWLGERVADDRRLAARVEAWRSESLLVETGGRTRLTEAAFLVSDALFADLL